MSLITFFLTEEKQLLLNLTSELMPQKHLGRYFCKYVIEGGDEPKWLSLMLDEIRIQQNAMMIGDPKIVFIGGAYVKEDIKNYEGIHFAVLLCGGQKIKRSYTHPKGSLNNH